MKRDTRLVLTGAITVACGLLLALTPLVLPGFDWNKYFVTFGVIFALLGAVIAFNALVDLVRNR